MKLVRKAFAGVFALAIFGLWGSPLSAQVSMSDVTIQQGQTGDVELSWTDGGSGAAGVSLTNISFSDDTDLDNITVYVTDAFPPNDEVVCSSTPTTVAANTAVSCNAAFTTVDLENTAAQTIGDISNYARFRIEVAPGAGAQTVTISGEWESFDTSGTSISAGNAVSAEIEITEGPQPVLAFNPAPGNLTFSAETGQQDSTDVQVCNTEAGAAGSEIDVTGVAVNTTDNSGGTFSQTNDCSSPLTPGDCCTVSVAFDSQNGGDATSTGDLDITTSAGDGAWSLSGTSTDGPAAALTVTPQTDGDFGQLLTNDESDTRTFVVSNSGQTGSDLSVDSAADPGGDFTVTGGTCDPGTTTLGDGASCTVVVTFAPTSDGVQNQTLTVNGTDTTNSTSLSDSAAVTGEGVSEPRFSSDPATGIVNLGTTSPGSSINRDVLISNEGNQDLTVSCGSLGGSDAGQFTLTPSAPSFTVASGGDPQGFNVACDVPDVGTIEATLSCTTNDADNDPADYTFRCTGRPLVIPTMQPWGLVLLTLLMLAVGGFSIRFFRA